MKEIALVAIKSVYHNIDSNRRDNSFEVFYKIKIFGLDFMIDD